MTASVMSDIQRLRAEQRELELWLDTHPLCPHSPGSRPMVCARCLTNDEWDRRNRALERLLRYGGQHG